MELFKSAKDADIGSISKLLKHSLSFISPEQYIEKLSYPEPSIRAIAVYGLGVLKRKSNLQYIINTLRNDENDIVRTSAIIALTFFEKPDILDRVQFSLYDESDIVRLAAIDLFTRNKYYPAKEKIAKTLKDDNSTVVMFALDYIDALKLKEYKSQVFELLDDYNPIIIQNAIATLITLEADEYKDNILSRFMNDVNPLVKMAVDWLKEGIHIKRDINKF